jgi:hypothetical protein
MPTRRPASTTTAEPTSADRILAAASASVCCGPIASGSVVIADRTVRPSSSSGSAAANGGP